MSSLGPARPRISPPQALAPEATFSLDLDIGEVADGYHLIVRNTSLTAENLLFGYAFVPELSDEARKEIWPNMNYGADVSTTDWNQGWSEGDVYERPQRGARHAWFDFFPPDYEWTEHLDQYGPDRDYLRSRIARLTVDLKTGQAHIEK
jgi:hypothetical protein